MPKRREYRDHCALAAALELLGDRWTLLVVRDLVLGPRRFGQLQSNLDGVAPDVLTSRLRLLQTSGVIEAGVDDGDRGYRLTSHGADLVPALRALAMWGRPLLPEHPDATTLSARSVLTSIVLGPPRGPDDRVVHMRFHVEGELADITFERGVPRPSAGDALPTVSITATVPALRELLRARRRSTPLPTGVEIDGATAEQLRRLLASASV